MFKCQTNEKKKHYCIVAISLLFNPFSLLCRKKIKTDKKTFSDTRFTVQVIKYI